MTTINAAALLTVIPAASNEEGRPLLCGVYLRADGVAIATNGHMMLAHRNAHELGEPVILGDVKAMTRFLKDAVKRQRKADAPVTVTLIPGTIRQARLECDGAALTVPVIGGGPDNPYPDVSRVVPREGKDVGAIRFDTDYLARLDGMVTLHFTGPTTAAALTCADNPDWYGLLMPCRDIGGGAEPFGCPWMAEPTALNDAA